LSKNGAKPTELPPLLPLLLLLLPLLLASAAAGESTGSASDGGGCAAIAALQVSAGTLQLHTICMWLFEVTRCPHKRQVMAGDGAVRGLRLQSCMSSTGSSPKDCGQLQHQRAAPRHLSKPLVVRIGLRASLCTH
jgi:hypothetical protein